MSVANPTPAIPAGATVTFHYFIPAGAPIAWVQPFAASSTGAFLNTFSSPPTLGAWTALTVAVPAGTSAITNLGFQFRSTAAFTGTVYVDSINW
jgi:hypothetical protein